jgi:hypothetical protein
MKTLRSIRDAVHRMKVVTEVAPRGKPESPLEKIVLKLKKKPGVLFMLGQYKTDKKNTAASLVRRLKGKGALATLRTVKQTAGVPRHVAVYAKWPLQ